MLPVVAAEAGIPMWPLAKWMSASFPFATSTNWMPVTALTFATAWRAASCCAELNGVRFVVTMNPSVWFPSLVENV